MNSARSGMRNLKNLEHEIVDNWNVRRQDGEQIVIGPVSRSDVDPDGYKRQCLYVGDTSINTYDNMGVDLLESGTWVVVHLNKRGSVENMLILKD